MQLKLAEQNMRERAHSKNLQRSVLGSSVEFRGKCKPRNSRSWTNPKQKTQKHIIVKLLKTRDEEKTLKAARGKQNKMHANMHSGINVPLFYFL